MDVGVGLKLELDVEVEVEVEVDWVVELVFELEVGGETAAAEEAGPGKDPSESGTVYAMTV